MIFLISIICVYNDESILEEFLLKSLKRQTVEFELILINNTSGRFKSAAKALNHGGNRANGNYIMFVHQDVRLCSDSWLEECERMLEELPDLGIAGVAGISEKGKINSDRGRNVFLMRDPPIKWPWGKKITRPERVQTLDEFLLIIPMDVFDQLKFDEVTCDDWHLYGVDYCLSVRELGYYTYVLPLNVHHLGGTFDVRKSILTLIVNLGPLPDTYFRTLKKVLEKHGNTFEWVYTSVGAWTTKYPITFQRIIHSIKLTINLIFKKFGLKEIF
ncbi:glycosyltransferase [Methanothermobacter tenebrarum]